MVSWIEIVWFFILVLLFVNGFIYGRIYEMNRGVYRRAYEASHKQIDEMMKSLTNTMEKHQVKEEKI